jgi:hypothetical protein
VPERPIRALDGRSFKIVVRPLRDQDHDPIPEPKREGTHVVRATCGGLLIFSTPRGVDPEEGMEMAFDAVRDYWKENPC